MLRRSVLLSPAWLAFLGAREANALPAKTLIFPRDHGAHEDSHLEWWYLTGYANAGSVDKPRMLGFQITFFRTRITAAQNLQSRFAAKQLLFAHVAVTDVAAGKHWHDQRIARAGFDIAQASSDTTDVKIRDWRLTRHSDGRYSARLITPEFGLELQATPTQSLMLQGDKGLSRKGPEVKQASYYYSQPQLEVTGQIILGGQRIPLQGARAWLDHEWSEEILHPEAVGWDWIGMNLLDGSALMAFQLRKADGAPLWVSSILRHASATHSSLPGQTFQSHSLNEIKFKPLNFWVSPASGARYPIEWQLRTPQDSYTIRALLPNQELDSRASTGAIYWEGLSELRSSQGQLLGYGYLEMTGYASRLRL